MVDGLTCFPSRGGLSIVTVGSVWGASRPVFRVEYPFVFS